MKKYLLLRDNQQSGPYSLDEMRALSLKPHDLIWIESESNGWKYPEEVEELKEFSAKNTAAKESRVFVSLPESNASFEPKASTEYFAIEDPELVSEPSLLPLQELKEKYSPDEAKKNIWQKRIFHGKEIGSVAAVFIGVVMGAVIIKKLVDGSTNGIPIQTASAIPILDRDGSKPTDNFKNAIVTEVVPVFKTEKKISSKIRDIKKQVYVKNNAYKVGLFGGVNGLQLTVFNTSVHFVDKVVVAVDYLRPNGEIVQSENVLFSSIKPKSAQTIAIPGSNRGVKVKYKILKVYSHEYQAAIREV